MQQWGPPRVRLRLPPQHGVHLLAWGCDAAGRWWALLTWQRHIARGFEAPTELWCTAWAAARYVEPVEHEDYTRVPRIRLDDDSRWWPTPPGPRLGHFGVLEQDTPLDPPEGYRWTSPRYSKRR